MFSSIIYAANHIHCAVDYQQCIHYLYHNHIKGWWHTVLNLETSLAVTQNFGYLHSYRIVADALREADPDAFREWSINAQHIWREYAYK